MIGAPLNFKHVYHFGGGEHDLNSDQLSTQTSSTMLRSANSSDLGEKSPTQSDVIDKKYSRRSFYKDDYWWPYFIYFVRPCDKRSLFVCFTVCSKFLTSILILEQALEDVLILLYDLFQNSRYLLKIREHNCCTEKLKPRNALLPWF